MVIGSGQWLPVPPGIYYSLLCKYRWAMNHNAGFNHTITQEKSKFDSSFATWVHMSSNKYVWSITSGKGIQQYFYMQSSTSLSWGLKRVHQSFSFLVEKAKPNQTHEKKMKKAPSLSQNGGVWVGTLEPSLPAPAGSPRAGCLELCWDGTYIFFAFTEVMSTHCRGWERCQKFITRVTRDTKSHISFSDVYNHKIIATWNGLGQKGPWRPPKCKPPAMGHLPVEKIAQSIIRPDVEWCLRAGTSEFWWVLSVLPALAVCQWLPCVWPWWCWGWQHVDKCLRHLLAQVPPGPQSFPVEMLPSQATGGPCSWRVGREDGALAVRLWLPAAASRPSRSPSARRASVAGTATAIPWEATQGPDGACGNCIKTRNGESQAGALQSTELDVPHPFVLCCISLSGSALHIWVYLTLLSSCLFSWGSLICC